MPTQERWNEMKAALRESAKAFDAAKDDKARHAAGTKQAEALIRLVHCDREILDECLTRPFGALESAAYDVGQGANPPLLQHSPPRNRKATLTSREQVQGCLAGVLEILMTNNMGTQAAAAWLAKKAREHRVVSYDGGAISPRQVISWRKEIVQGRGPRGAIDTFYRLTRAYNTRLGYIAPTDSRKGAEALAVATIKSLSAISPTSAPRQNRQTD